MLLGQPDTTWAKSQVPVGDEYYSHKDFWYKINYRDQELRISPNIEQIDEENLAAVVYYFNRFGYPNFKKYGDHAKIVQGVWGHNRYSKINRYTFPIILAGYKAGAIPEPAFREYYLRIMYQLRLDGYDYKTKSLDYLQNLLGLKEAEHISIDTIMNMLREYKQIRSDTQVILGRWYAITPADTFYFEGKKLVKEDERHKVILYATTNGKYYILQESFANAKEPVELSPVDQQMTKFKIVGKESSKYYKIAENKDLIYTNDNGDKLKSYVACR